VTSLDEPVGGGITSPNRASRLAQTFVALADTLVEGYDVVELSQTLVETCASMLDAVDAGIMLADPSGELEVLASTNERTHLVDLMQLRAGEGPCVEAYQTGRVVSVADLATVRERWPLFTSGAESLGYSSSHAIPMKLRHETIGSLNLFRARTGALSNDDAVTAKALADAATIGIVHERALRETDIARSQLQHALDSRVIIEQAKGFLAQTHGVDMDTAFRVLRTHARSNGLKLDDLARDVVNRVISL
jgi:GAF domain-containing protein